MGAARTQRLALMYSNSRFNRAALSAFALLAAAPTAGAALLVNPSGGNVLFDDSVARDDESISGTVPFSGEFFGETFTNLTATVSINGHFNFSGDSAAGGTLGTSLIDRVAPLWMDLSIAQNSGGSVVESAGSTYYAISWLNVGGKGLGATPSSFQAVFFFEETTMGGLTFQANDIVFAYDFVGSLVDGQTASVGLEHTDGSSALFTDGQIESSTELPFAPGEYILFTPNGYNGSVTTTAVPEPSSYAALAGFFVLAGTLLRRRRQG